MFSLGAVESALHGISRFSFTNVVSRTHLKSRKKNIPSTSINSTPASHYSCTPSSPKLILHAPSLPFTRPPSTEPCSRLLAALPYCVEVKRSLHHSHLSCTRVSTPLLKSSKPQIDRSLVPELLEKDLIESAIKGWGPGGQAVNKTNNAVFLKHIPTGLFVKVHNHRMRHKNSLEARVLLLDKLDDLVNGPSSVSAQKARLLEKRSVKSESKARKMRDLKAQWNQTLGGADAASGEDGLRDESGVATTSGDGLRDIRSCGDGLKDESSGGGDGLNDDSAGYDCPRVDSGGTTAGEDGLRDESAGGCADTKYRLSNGGSNRNEKV